ncbi:MAG: hypothetical protein WC967_07820 [Balneolaceae bacterium]
MKTLSVILITALFSVNLYAQKLTATELPIELYNPNDMIVTDSGTIIIYDLAADEFPLISYSIKQKEIIGSVLWGKGPGEIGGTLYKTITKGPRGTVSVFDRNNARINIYSHDLTLQETLNLAFLKGNPMQAGFLNENIFFAIPIKEDFVRLHKVTQEDGEIIIESSPYLVIKNNDSEYLKPLDNFLLKQGIFLKQSNENLFLAFEYSSLILSLDSNGIKYEVFGPEKFLLPDEKSKSGMVYALPDVSEHPVCNLDIDVLDDFVFVLKKGEKAGKTNILKKVFSIGKMIEELEHSDKILVFKASTGEFIEELKLPVKVSKIEIANEKMYMLSAYQQDAKLYELSISDLMEYQQN